MLMMRHCRTLHVHDCRGRRETFTVQEYTLVLEGGLLKEMGTVLRYNYAFSNVVVKFCAILSCLTCLWHLIVSKGYQFLTHSCTYILQY